MNIENTLSPIKVDNPDAAQYAMALLNAPQLTQNDTVRIRSELLVLLAALSEKRMRGESRSIPQETAKTLMESALYCIGTYLSSVSQEEAAEALKSESVQALYAEGLSLIQKKMLAARKIQTRILHHLFSTPNVYYRQTVQDGINGFFKLYHPQFAAHETHITADYPLCLARPAESGITFILKYLRYFEAENDFCSLFSAKSVHHLLCSVSMDYRSCPINLFEPVFYAAAGLLLQNRDPDALNLCEDDLRALTRLFADKTAAQITLPLKDVLRPWLKRTPLSPYCITYIEACLPKLAAGIANAAENRLLSTVFLIPTDPEKRANITITYGDRMSPSAYRALLHKLLLLDGKEKTDQMLGAVHAMGDFLDLLSDITLTEDEAACLANALPPPLFAAMLGQFPDADLCSRESEQAFCQSLWERYRHFGKAERAAIDRLTDAIECGSLSDSVF